MASPPARKHHALAIPLSSQGHINPLMRLCEKLASHGFTITFLYIDPIHKRLAELSKPQESNTLVSHQSLDIRKAHVPFEANNDFRFSIQSHLEAQQCLVPCIEQLLHKLNQEDLPVTCLISDFSMSGPTQLVAEKFNIPRITLFPSSASTLLLINYVLEGVIPTKDVLEVVMNGGLSKGDIFKEGLPGLPTLLNGDLPNIQHVVDENAFIYEFLTQCLQNCKESAHAIVVNSFEELEGAAFKSLSSCLNIPVYGVGPFAEQESSTSLWEEDDECMQWLDEQPPLSVLFISFGSVALLSRSQFEEIQAALLSSHQRFLWVFRPGLIKDAPESSFPPDFLVSTCGKGYVVNWAPQLRVLSHPSVGAFFTHCGWNSTLEAVAHGVPMLCFPYFYDQFLDAKFVVEEWKVGLLFTSTREDGLVERDEVERIIKSLIEGEEGKAFRKNATQLKDASRRCILPGGTSYKNIEAFIQSL